MRSLTGDYVVYRSHALGEATNNLAEVDGIHEAANYVLSHQSEIPDSVPIYIFVDNRLAINIAVGRAYCHASWCQGLAQLTRTKLKQLGQSRRIYLFWVPGHADVEGNELSDKSAKYASAGHSCFDKPPARFIKSVIPQVMYIPSVKYLLRHIE